jgi:hypothetical protein
MDAADGTLLERWIASRDAEAFNEIVSRHAGLVYGACRRMVRNHAAVCRDIPHFSARKSEPEQ